MRIERVIIIRDKTRLEQLVERFNSKAQAEFYLKKGNEKFLSPEERTGFLMTRDVDGFTAISEENDTFYTSLKKIQNSVSKKYKYKVVYRELLPTYLFSTEDLVIVVGQDGLVANTAKYVHNHPIIAINPDPTKYDGTLLPFRSHDIENVIFEMENDTYKKKSITMAVAEFSDGQRLLAFNDFFIGAATHVSARYAITYAGKTENQSSSGIIVSTGAGFTGWMSSVFNMARNINKPYKLTSLKNPRMDWATKQLLFVVREPYQSVVTKIGIGYGRIDQDFNLKIDSKMATNGIVFSDGIEADFIHFNSGTSVEVKVAKEETFLVIK